MPWPALQRVQEHSLDAGIGAITVTVGCQQRMDFSQPFYFTGLAIAVRAQLASIPPQDKCLVLRWLADCGILLALRCGGTIYLWWGNTVEEPSANTPSPAAR
ncbi:MAG: transporter substrate-binding domain-containing protein [Phycisphaerae bacterium]|nr:transporter substrate-binding domain-containing protein [Phycisphaerae bacterium]